MDISDHDHSHQTVVELTAGIVSAYVSHNTLHQGELGRLISDVHAALKGTNTVTAKEETLKEPAVSIRTSVKPDHITCLEDGKRFKSLKRHLRTDHDMSPAEYRAKWGLKAEYPMVAPSYAQARSELAKSMGLGRKAVEPAAAPVKAARPKRVRKPTVAAE